jgi:16S rRNA (adenine1518-N6/adenine1519-N6)-dimethyltransferase
MLRERAEQRELEGAERLTVVHHDCLADKRTLAAPLVETVAGRPFKLIANLPYGAATPLVMTLLARHPNCVTLGVTVQRELADRMLAQPGSKDFGPLSVLMHALTSARRIAVAPPECFWPRPDVTSALVVAERLTTPLTADPTGLADFCQSLFSQRRKQIGAVLNKLIGPAGAEALRDLAIAPETRAEELDVHRLIALHARCVHASPRSSSGPA